MAPMYGTPNYDFIVSSEVDSEENDQLEDYIVESNDWTEMAFWYLILLILMLIIWLLVFFCLRIVAIRQKTRNPQQRRMYVGPRARGPSLDQAEPTIYVSPANLPPPPKYEAMAPPSYEEVVGVHYPNYHIQPITQPISAALAQAAQAASTNSTPAPAPALVTLTNEERRTSLARS